MSIARAIRTGETTAEEVVYEHCLALHRSQPRTNALACDRFEDALAEARAADERVAAARAAGTEDELPPLLGVPCTIKESIALAGMPHTSGLVGRRGRLADATAPTVQRLLDAGAIAVGSTNVSQLTMWIESDNRVYGRTRNAYDPRRIAGGSSGGEGAAVGSGGVPFGLGSDIAGSIRLPAFFNGVFGHKPSADLVPNTGQFPSTEGDAARLLSIGPLARRAEDLMPVLRLIAGPDGTDRRCVEERALADPADVTLAGRRVLVNDDGSFLPPSRELREARDRAADALASAGAKVETVSLRPMRRVLELYLATLGAGATTSLSEVVAEERFTRGPRGWTDAARGRGDHTLQMLITLSAERLQSRLPEARTRKAIEAGEALEREVVGVLGDGVMLHPPFARVAPRHNGTIGRPWTLSRCAVFNLLGFPVTQVPLGLGPSGLPVGVQVAAAEGCDHVTIAVALELERRFGGWVPPDG